jgi:ribonuclease BN (tRNA processing enzyme)
MRVTIYLISVFAGACVAPPPLRAQVPSRDSTGTSVVLLGTGMPRPDPRASGPATAIVVGKRVFLVDAGPGVERRLAAAHLPIAGVDALFITHLHSDHTLGYPDLIFTSWVMGRREPLQVYGPPGTQAMTDHLIAAYREDIDVRTNGLEHATPNGYRVAVHEIAPGVVYDSAGVRVTAIPVPHGIWRFSYGYRFDTPDRVVVVSGDTRPSEALGRAATGADVLVHEVYSADELRRNPYSSGPDWPRYMHEFHTSDVELGALAAHAAPTLLVLSHIVRRDATDSALIAGVRAGGYTGRVVVGHDLEQY